ncbi:NAD(P)-dependent oxidoreductase [Arenibacter sp. GZD96]|uniref:NAD(P)-dependent oxidoreductase n=1 Tax=Aurantibrevibacter litoralis TaxID=3106030 RepID=UPI002AFF480B|nr:NAD(P)-dependent oxidoreductase [Arenibacter sp. GZD-96]MEA1786373.1 NAD(P)-dependent oxidoreductase [Arenibacter sp. GZD-96]
MKILANDGLAPSAIAKLKTNGFDVLTTTVAQEQLENYIKTHSIDILLVRSATQVRKDLIDGCSSLKIIGRGGVGLDNIDVAYAQKKGIKVIHTPAASSDAVAELVFAHLLGGWRFLHDANRNMPLDGDTKFKELKKAYAKGVELRGKTIGIIGFGRIGQATAKMALGMGMKVLFHDPNVEKAIIELHYFDGQRLAFTLEGISKAHLLQNADVISLSLPVQKSYVLSTHDFEIMKEGVAIINTARGGVLDEVALIQAIENGKVSFAGLDVFESEPTPEIRILMHPQISLSPHIGAATVEAQERIGLELANQIIASIN